MLESESERMDCSRTSAEFQSMNPLSVSIADACRLLGLSRSSILALIARGHLASIKAGRRTLIPTTALYQFLDVADGEAPTAPE